MIVIQTKTGKLVQYQVLRIVKDPQYDNFGLVEKIMPYLLQVFFQEYLVIKNPKMSA